MEREQRTFVSYDADGTLFWGIVPTRVLINAFLGRKISPTIPRETAVSNNGRLDPLKAWPARLWIGIRPAVRKAEEVRNIRRLDPGRETFSLGILSGRPRYCGEVTGRGLDKVFWGCRRSL